MRKFLLSFVTCLTAAAWLSPISAYWTPSEERLTVSDITVGKTIVIEACSSVKLSGFLGSWQLVSQHLDECLYEVEDAGINENVNRQQFFFKQKSTGKYLGYNANEGRYVTSADDAYKICVFSAYASEDEDGNLDPTEARFVPSGNSNWASAWDELSVTLPVNIAADYMTKNSSFISNSPDFNSPAMNSQYSSCRAWNIYEATEVQDADEELTANLEYYVSKGWTTEKYVAGTTPGYYNAEAAAKFTAAYNAVENAIGGSTTYAQAKQLVADLEAARLNVDTMVNPIITGYYRVLSACTTLDTLGVKFAMQGTNSLGSASGVYWDTLNVKDGKQIFYFERQESGNYLVKSLRYGYYWNRLGVLPSQVDGVTEQPKEQIFTALSKAGQWRITNTAATSQYAYPEDYTTATEGAVAYVTSIGNDNRVAWVLEPVTDQTLIDSLIQAAHDEDINASLKLQTMTAQTELDNTAKVYDPDLDTPLVPYASSYTDDCSDRLIVSSCDEMSSARTPAAMIDNNISSYWHTQWAKSNLDKHPKYNWIVAKLSDPVQQFVFRLQTRQDNNFNNWVVLAYVYASETEPDADGNADWEKITEIAIPDIKPTKNKSAYVTPVIQMDKAYKYIKFYGAQTNNGSASNGLVAMQYSEFNLFPCTLNEDKSASLRPDMQDAIAAFQAAIDKATAIYQAGKGTQADIDELNAAKAAYFAAYPDPTNLIAEIKAAQLLCDQALPEEDTYGGVSETAMETLQAKIVSIVDDPSDESSYDPLYKLTRAEMDAKYNDLKAAEQTFLNSVKSIEDGKVYFIVNAGNPSYDDAHATNGCVIYTRGHDKGSGLFWGGSAGEYEQNADAWWQAVKTSDSTYAFRNVASGWYMSEASTSGKAYTLSDTVVNFQVNYIGGAFELKPIVGAGKTAYKVHAQKNGYYVVGWNSSPVYNSACAWTFADVEDLSANVQKYINNTIQVVTLPYPTTELPSGGADVQCFSLVGATRNDAGNITSIKVTPYGGDGLAAGTPFIMILGDTMDYTGGTAAEDTVYLDMHPDNDNFELSTEVQNLNGLIGAPKSVALNAAGYGFFDGRNLVATTSTAVTVAAQTGYIDAASVEEVESEGGEIMVIPVANGGVLNSIKEAVINGNKIVNVYTIDGILVKKGVKANDAAQSLSKGVYIIGKNKVLVK